MSYPAHRGPPLVCCTSSKRSRNDRPVEPRIGICGQHARETRRCGQRAEPPGSAALPTAGSTTSRISCSAGSAAGNSREQPSNDTSQECQGNGTGPPSSRVTSTTLGKFTASVRAGFHSTFPSSTSRLADSPWRALVANNHVRQQFNRSRGNDGERQGTRQSTAPEPNCTNSDGIQHPLTAVGAEQCEKQSVTTSP